MPNYTFKTSFTSSIIRRALVGASALCFSSGLASAADMPIAYKAPPPPPPPGFSWNGGYIGVAIGYGWGKDDLYEYFSATGAFTGFEQHYDANGVLGGLFLGANYQTGNIVLGIEADIEGADLKGSWIDPLTGGAGDTHVGWQGSLRGRIGYAFDRALIYGTGGLAFGDVSHTYQNLLTGINETTSGVRTGWTAGGGIEYAFATNFLIRAEYRYVDFGMTQFDSVTSFPGLTGTQNARFDTMRLGLAYKF